MLNNIHPTAVIGPQVTFGTGNIVGPFCVIQGPVKIGDNNYFAAHVSVGGAAEVHGSQYPPSWAEESTEGGIVIGSDNIFKEFLTINQGWADQTRVGDRCMLMAKAHLGHDAQIANDVTISCAVQVGGHTRIAEFATVGLGTVIHQRLFIGAGSMVGMGSAVTKNVAPFAVAVGSPAKTNRLNTYRLDKMDYGTEVTEILESMILGGDGPGESGNKSLPEDVAKYVEEWREASPAH